MNRYEQLFNTLKANELGFFVPFVMLGDPTLEDSFQIIETLIESGADALELGIPFSDPLADGPTIQSATLRALESGTTPAKCFELIKKIRTHYPTIPIGLLVYANLVYRPGVEHFYENCQQAGVDSVLVADVPLSEYPPFYSAAEKSAICPILICPPNANDDVIQGIAQYGKGYTYLLSRAGVTGAENKAIQNHEHLIKKLRDYGAPPAIQGFGISEPEQVKQALESGAIGAISGSAIVKIIEIHLDDKQRMLQELAEFVLRMKAATYY